MSVSDSAGSALQSDSVTSSPVFQCYCHVAEALGSIAWIADSRGAPLHYNEKWWTYSGLNPRTFTRDSGLDVVHPDDRRDLLEGLEEKVERNEAFEVRYRLRRYDGLFRWHIAKLVPLNAVSPTFWLGTATDVHDHVQAQERAYSLFMQAPAAISIHRGPDMVLELVNGQAQAIIGLDPSHYLGRPIQESFPEVFEKSMKVMEEVYRTGKRIFAAEFPLQVTGPLQYYDVAFEPFRDELGEVAGVMVFAVNVTEKVEARNRNEDQLRWLENALNRIPLPLTFREPETGKVLFLNDALRELIGAEPSNGKDSKDLEANERLERSYRLADADDQPVPPEYSLTARLARGERIIDEEAVLHTKNGRYPLSVSGDTIPAAYGRSATVVTVAQDISRLKQIEDKLQRAIQARDDLMSVCGHEFKTPLSVLKLQTQLIRNRMDKNDPRALDPERIRKMLMDYERQVDRMIRLVEDMLDLNRINSGKMQLRRKEFGLVKLIEDVLDGLSEAITASRSQVKMDLREDVRGYWDRDRIEQVLINLLTNATRYGQAKPIEVRLSENDGMARLEVRDQGMGIAKGDHERIFNRFERAVSSRHISGLGLGLYIVREIVCAHEGSVSVASELGKGATFTVDLPLGSEKLKN